MNRLLISLTLFVLLSACSSKVEDVRITHGAAQSAIEKAQAQPRSEPIFYNGKTYQLDYAPNATEGYDMQVSGMSASQEKDAVGLSTSALRHFSCTTAQTAKLQSKPNFVGGQWRLSVQCG